MASSKSRVGIERKILSTILWVCILPIGVILVMGYIIARSNQSTGVQEALLNAAQKTAEGIRIESSGRMSVAENLANDPLVIHSVSPYREDKVVEPFVPLDDASLRAWLDRFRKLESSHPNSITVYDRDRNFLLSVPGTPVQGTLDVDIPEGTRTAAFSGFQTEDNIIVAAVTAPIYSPFWDELIGYVSVESQINTLLEYAMGSPGGEVGGQVFPDVYQIVYVLGDTVTTIQGDVNSTAEGIPGLALIETHEKLESLLLERPQHGTHSLPRYIRVDGVGKYNAMGKSVV